MSWPRKNEVGRIYRDRDDSYLVVFVDERIPGNGCWEAIANALIGPEPSLATTSIHPSYISERWLKRVSWDELPPEWQEAFTYFLVDDPVNIRGFWHYNYTPTKEGPHGSSHCGGKL